MQTGTVVAPYAFAWSNGATTEDLSNVGPGTYTVVITDGNGCTTECTAVVAAPDALVLDMSATDANCGLANGTANVDVVGGVAAYSYVWSNGQTTQTAINLAAGTYVVTVTDQNGCTAVDSVVVGDTPALACSVPTFTQPSCAGYSNGSATVVPTGGTGTVTYSWSTAPTQTTATATGLAAGTYFVTVTDAIGCQSTCMVMIVDPAPLTVAVQIGNNACVIDSANVLAVPSGGSAPYTYVWSNGHVTGSATTFATGTHVVTVTDANGCEISEVFTITPANPMTCNTWSTNADCGMTNGTMTANVFGGVAPYSYSWNTVPVQTNAIATDVAAGTYMVTITDANGCITECYATVQQPAPISTLMTPTDVTCNGDSDGAITLTNFNGGQAPFTFLWTNGATDHELNRCSCR